MIQSSRLISSNVSTTSVASLSSSRVWVVVTATVRIPAERAAADASTDMDLLTPESFAALLEAA